MAIFTKSRVILQDYAISEKLIIFLGIVISV